MAQKKKTKLPYWLTILIVAILWIGGDQLKSWLGMETDQQKIEKSAQEADMSGLEIPVISNGKQGQILQRTGYTLSYDTKNKTPQLSVLGPQKGQKPQAQRRQKRVFYTSSYGIIWVS